MKSIMRQTAKINNKFIFNFFFIKLKKKEVVIFYFFKKDGTMVET